MKFSEIPGHETVKERLRTLANTGHIPHALVLEGPEGTGKLAMARAFAQYIHCEHRKPDGDACGECNSCRLHQSFNHIDTYYSYPVVKAEGASTPPVSDDYRPEWCEFLNEGIYPDFQTWAAGFKRTTKPSIYVTEATALMHSLSLTSHVSQTKIVIMWLPERLNEEAANKLLKLVEEPFDDSIFIMVSNDPASILPTIYSRTQRIAVPRLPDQVVAQWLVDHKKLDMVDAMAIAHNAAGNVTEAARQCGQVSGVSEMLEFFTTLMRKAYQRDVNALRQWSADLHATGREKQIAFYDYASRLVRENFVLRFHVPGLNYLSQSELQFSERFCRFIHEGNAERFLSVFTHARNDIAANANAKMVNFDVAVKSILLLKNG